MNDSIPWKDIVRTAELTQQPEPGVTLSAAEHTAMMQEVLDHAQEFGHRMRTPVTFDSEN